MAASADSPASTADREIVVTRLLDAPRELVFDVWTNPEHVDQWWGPRGFRNSTHDMDVRAGGAWNYVMHGPDGVDYDNRASYLEVVRPERLVYLHGSGVANDPKEFHVTVTFADEGARTRLTMRAVFATAALLEEQKKFGAVEGGRETMDRLEEFLAAMNANR
jgi:uncharacterized protein YndB with AHSA1/START domain